jgi:uncharacterized protein YggE
MHKAMVFSLSLVAVIAIAACQDRIVAVAPAPPAAAADAPGVMAVTGSAVIEVNPDCADLTMTLTADEYRPSQATRAVNQHQTDLVAALHRHGVKSDDLKLSLMTLAPVYANDAYPAAPRLLHYTAAITITVTTRDFSTIGTLMDVGSDAGATQISSQFRRSDLPQLKKKVRDMALAAARDKAHQTAEALGIDLGRVTAVSETAGGAMWSSMYFPQTANSVERMPAQSASSSVGGSTQTISLDVSVTYQLGRKA